MGDEGDVTRLETTDIKKPRLGRGRLRMNWKSLLTIFVILSIGTLLLTTESGAEFAGQTLDFAKVKVGNFISGLFSGSFSWSVPFSSSSWKIPSGEQFLIILSVEKGALYGQQYSVPNTSLSMRAVCDTGIKLNDVMIKPQYIECSIYAEEMKGVFEYTESGTVKFEGEVGSIMVDGSIYTSDSSRLKASFEVMPIEFELSDLLQRKITIDLATGSIERLNPDGSTKSTEGLDAESLEINGFMGLIKLDGSNIRLQGSAVSVQGIGAHSSFSW
jgi:hypothetical protein